MGVSLALYAILNDTPTAVPYPSRVGREHCHQNNHIFHKMPVSPTFVKRNVDQPPKLPLYPERCPLIPATFLNVLIQHLLSPQAAFMLFRRRTPSINAAHPGIRRPAPEPRAPLLRSAWGSLA